MGDLLAAEVVDAEVHRRVANRFREAQATGATTVAVGCPFCLTMLTDAAKKVGENAPAVKDVAEILAEKMTEKVAENITENHSERQTV